MKAKFLKLFIITGMLSLFSCSNNEESIIDSNENLDNMDLSNLNFDELHIDFNNYYDLKETTLEEIVKTNTEALYAETRASNEHQKNDSTTDKLIGFDIRICGDKVTVSPLLE